MTRAEVLRAKLVGKIEARGVKFIKDNWDSYILTESEPNKFNNNRRIMLRDIYRHNGTSENCSVELIVYQKKGIYLDEVYNSGKITEKTGERALKNRIDKALEKYLYSGNAPASEGLDLFFNNLES